MRIGSTRGIATQSVSVCLSYKVRSRRPDCPRVETRGGRRRGRGAPGRASVKVHAARRRTWDKKSGTKEILYSENKKRLNTTH